VTPPANYTVHIKASAEREIGVPSEGRVSRHFPEDSRFGVEPFVRNAARNSAAAKNTGCVLAIIAFCTSSAMRRERSRSSPSETARMSIGDDALCLAVGAR